MLSIFSHQFEQEIARITISPVKHSGEDNIELTSGNDYFQQNILVKINTGKWPGMMPMAYIMELKFQS